jgi:hypothetical protein
MCYSLQKEFIAGVIEAFLSVDPLPTLRQAKLLRLASCERQ